MAAPKQPQDHKNKSTATVKDVDGGREVTIDGFTVTILDAALSDYEVFENLAFAQKGDPAALPMAFRGLFGDELPRVKDHLRDPSTGRTPVETMMQFANELFEVLNPNS